jgi:hypothetical protein
MKMILMCVGLASAVWALPGLLTNPCFETGDATGWTTWNSPWGGPFTTDFAATPAIEGLYSLNMSCPGGSFGVYQEFAVIPGEEYFFTAVWKGDGSNAWFECLLLDEAYSYAVADGPAAEDIIAKHDTWTLGPVPFGPEQVCGSRVASGTVMTVVLKCGASGGSADVWFDCVDVCGPIPEPGTCLLVGTGLLGLAGLARRK